MILFCNKYWMENEKRALTCNSHFLWSHSNMWLVKLLPKLQPFVAISLFIAFLLVFGLPAFSKFTKMETYIKETHLESVPLKTPAITICVEPVREPVKKKKEKWGKLHTRSDLPFRQKCRKFSRFFILMKKKHGLNWLQMAWNAF